MTATAERAHAILSASGAERWLQCPPSARLEEQFPDEESVFAAEGTLAHALAELHVGAFVGLHHSPYFDQRLNELCADPQYSPEMLDHVNTYLDLAIERILEARERSKDAIVLVEQRLDFSAWVPEGFGTGDLVIIADGVLEVVDFKYGKGVPVSAESNPQMMLYALGAIDQFGMLYDIEMVRMTICQPRLDSISTYESSVLDLEIWGNGLVKPIAELAIDGGGEFSAGDHCRFCRARYTCRARADTNLELAKFDFTDPPLLSDDEIGEILARAEALQKWAADVQSYALDQAENHGKQWPGWKLVEGRSVRKYADADAIAAKLIGSGYPEAMIYERSLLGITAMEKTLGKKKFGDLLSELIVKPAGKPTLAPLSDKRPALNSVKSAQEDFADD